ncbi:hypothetical protein [Tistlia consotensis]|uniref:hypothetical protein n=1 Tax=Tistlia consotensis TaxID=1321365 RepID=UPI000A157CC3|nr:hypothetical protein [Tistlia consotensis]
MPVAERAALGLERLPGSLAEALAALEADAAVCGWFPPQLLESYLGVKRTEIDLLKGLVQAELCRRSAQVY